jgi:hypothetical protein
MAGTNSHIVRIREGADNSRSNNASAIRNYVSDVATSYLEQGPATGILIDRIADLQIQHQSGQLSATTESRVVSALNKLADKAQLPQHARTSALEFRLLRSQMLQAMPELNPGAYSNRSAAMEPAEMLYLVEALIYQKLNNPDYQLTADELNLRAVQRNAHPQADQAQKTGPTRSIRSWKMPAMLASSWPGFFTAVAESSTQPAAADLAL